MKPDLNSWKCRAYLQPKFTCKSHTFLSNNKLCFEPGTSTRWASSRPKRGWSSGNILDLSDTSMHDKETTPILRNFLNVESQTDALNSHRNSTSIDNRELLAENIALRNEINNLKVQVKELQMCNLRLQLNNDSLETDPRNEIKENTCTLLILEGEGQKKTKEISILEQSVEKEQSEFQINLIDELRARLKIVAESAQKAPENLIPVHKYNSENECLTSEDNDSSIPSVSEKQGHIKTNERSLIEESINTKQMYLMDELRGKLKINSENSFPVPQFIIKGQYSTNEIREQQDSDKLFINEGEGLNKNHEVIIAEDYIHTEKTKFKMYTLVEPRVENETPVPEYKIKRHTQQTSSLFSELLQLKKLQPKSYEILDDLN